MNKPLLPNKAVLRGLKEIAAYMGVTVPTIRRYIEDGLPASQVGNSWTTSPQLIDMWLLSRHQTDLSHKRELRRLRKLRRAAEQRAFS